MKTFILFFLILFSFIKLTAQQSATGYFNKAMEYKLQRNCNEVLNNLNKALKVKPDYGEALLEKGWCLNELNKPQDAIPVLYQADELLKNNYLVNYELGHAYYLLRNTDSAEKYFKKSYHHNSDNYLAAAGLGDVVREKKTNTPEALHWYLVACKIDSTRKKTNYWIGWCYNDLQMHDSAVYYLQKILIEEPNHTLAAVELGYAYYSLSRCREAVAALKPALLAKPKPEIAVYYTGMCMVKIGNKELALDKYNELVILNSAYAAKLLQEIQKLH